MSVNPTSSSASSTHHSRLTDLERRLSHLVYLFEYSCPKVCRKDSYHLDYERGRYRQSTLAALIRDAVPVFGLTGAELKEYSSPARATEVNRFAWGRISKRPWNMKGDFGELLLYLLLRHFYKAPRFAVKARLRSHMEEEIKGFDCAHFTLEDSSLVLWLGEAKLRNDFGAGLRSGLSSVVCHLQPKALKNELVILRGNVDDIEQTDPAYAKLLDALTGDISLDKLRIRVPVLLTYDSGAVSGSSAVDDGFRGTLRKELEQKFSLVMKHVSQRQVSSNVDFVFLVLSMADVSALKQQLDQIEQAMRVS